jgi:hypothetical protein
VIDIVKVAFKAGSVVNHKSYLGKKGVGGDIKFVCVYFSKVNLPSKLGKADRALVDWNCVAPKYLSNHIFIINKCVQLKDNFLINLFTFYTF